MDWFWWILGAYLAAEPAGAGDAEEHGQMTILQWVLVIWATIMVLMIAFIVADG